MWGLYWVVHNKIIGVSSYKVYIGYILALSDVGSIWVYIGVIYSVYIGHILGGGGGGEHFI